MKTTAGIVGIAGAAAALGSGALMLFMTSLNYTLAMHERINAAVDATSFRSGMYQIVAGAIALAFSVVLLCGHIRRASALLLMLCGIGGVFAQGWFMAPVLFVAGVLGLHEDFALPPRKQLA